MTAAYVTHGRKYHTDPNCPRMINGENFHDWEGDIDYGGGFTAGSYRREDPSAHHAAMRGKLPCLGCVPPAHRVFPPLYGQTFGHEPVWADRGSCVVAAGACNCPYHDEYLACDRCRPDGQPVPWPCTSAIVLGLAPREETTR